MAANLRIIPAIAIFFSSYFPLSLVLLIQDIDSNSFAKISLEKFSYFGKMLVSHPRDGVSYFFHCFTSLWNNPSVSLSITIACAVSILVLKLAVTSATGGENIKVLRSIKNPSDLMNYTVPYMVAFIGVELDNLPKVLGFLVFMFFMFILSYKSKQLFMNPVLAILGYSLYDVDYQISDTVRSSRILSKNDLIPEQRYLLDELASLPIITKKI